MSDSRARFLVVEDHAMVARAVARALERLRDVRVAHSANEALTLLHQNESWCGFVFDVMLGDGSGLDVLAHAREIYPSVPALVLTGHADREFINRAFALRASYLCKPAERSDVMQFGIHAIAHSSGGG